MKIKVGDELAFINHRWGTTFRKVDRITPTGRIVCGNITLNPNLSIRNNDVWDETYVELATPELKEKVALDTEKRRLIQKIKSANFEKFIIENLRKMCMVINHATKAYLDEDVKLRAEGKINE